MRSLMVLLSFAYTEAALLFHSGRVSTGKTFSIPIVRANRNRSLDGFAAQVEAFKKYGWSSTPVKSSSFVATTVIATKQVGSVKASGEKYNAAYISPVMVGTPGQRLNLNFDTGSSDLWIFSDRLGSGASVGHNVFNTSQSSTFRDSSDVSWRISYGDGSGAAGTVGTDVVNIGGATVTSQAIELATAVSMSFAEDADSDGLVGLGFPKLNRVTPTKQKTFFDNAKSSLKRPLFTVDLRNDGSGSYDFGFVDETKYTGGMIHVGINTTNGFWQFASPSFQVGSERFINTGATPAIIDTGTSLMLVDSLVAEMYWSRVPGAVHVEHSAYLFPCAQVQQLPSLSVAVGKKGHSVEIPGEYINYAPFNGVLLLRWVQSNRGNGMQIYGDLLLRQSFVVFYGGGSRGGEELGLGFAKKREDME